jgi:parallel beta-helix repeat protein
MPRHPAGGPRLAAPVDSLTCSAPASPVTPAFIKELVMKKLSILLCLSAMLDACGGGEGSAPMASPPVLAATVEEDDGEAATLSQPDGEAVDEMAQEETPGVADEADFTVRDYAPAGKALPAPQALAGGAAQLLYVAPAGSDSNPGTRERPFRSLMRAARAARAGSRVLVAPGAYTGGFKTSVSGAANARIVFMSTSKWGAKIVPPRDSPNKTAWDNRGSYVDIVGFDIGGGAYQGGKKWTHGIYSGGSYVSIRNNRVHHIAHDSECTHAGGAAIGVDSYYHGVEADVIANLVHDIGPAGCRFVHGIYVSTSGRIRNNIVYRVAEGGIHLWHDARDVIITNNTVTASNTGIIVGGGNNYFSSGPNDHTAVYSNIVYDNQRGIAEHGKTGPNNSYRNNLVYQNAIYNWRLKAGMTHSGTVSAAPLFVDNARAGNPSLRLSPGSPAIGRATPAYAEGTDFAGRPRDARAGYDIGALQH